MGLRVIAWPEAVGLAATVDAQAELSVDLRDAERLRRVLDEELRRGGLFVESSGTAELGSEAAVTLILPKPYESVQVLTRVVHVNADPAGLGLQVFDHLSVRRRLIAMLAPEALPVDIDAEVRVGTRFDLSVSARGQAVQARCLVEGVEPIPASTGSLTPTVRMIEAPTPVPAAGKPPAPQPEQLAAATAEALRALAASLGKARGKG